MDIKMIDEKIKRINELYNKSKIEPLTAEELAEQKTLREEYVKGFRKSMIDQLNNVSVEQEDGSVKKLSDLGIKE